MKGKCLITILMAIILIQVVNATICEDQLTPGQTCTMLTPSLGCAGNYTLYNETGYLTTGNMTVLNDSIYYFNFTQGEGSYLIQLCDNSTREIVVIGDEDSMIIGLIILIFAIIVLFGYLGYVFYKEENFAFYLCFLFWYLALLMPLFGLRVIIHSSAISAVQTNLLNMMYQVYLYLYVFMIIILLVYFIILVMRWMYGYDKTPKWKRRIGSDF